jgi:hypothetical protein
MLQEFCLAFQKFTSGLIFHPSTSLPVKPEVAKNSLFFKVFMQNWNYKVTGDDIGHCFLLLTSLPVKTGRKTYSLLCNELCSSYEQYLMGLSCWGGALYYFKNEFVMNLYGLIWFWYCIMFFFQQSICRVSWQIVAIYFFNEIKKKKCYNVLVLMFYLVAP